MACTYCVGLPEWIIKRYDFWTVHLKKNQAYLGTMIIALNRHVPDLFSASPEEMAELQRIMVRLREATKDMFGAKMFSYVSQSSLENLHANIQIIPRYSGEARWENYRIADREFGRGYDPVKNLQLQGPDYMKLITSIRDKLEHIPEHEVDEDYSDENENIGVPRP